MKRLQIPDYEKVRKDKTFEAGRQDVIKFLEADGVIVHTGSLYFYRYLVDHNGFDDRWFALKGSKTLEELPVKE